MKSKKEIKEFVEENIGVTSRIAPCTLGCGQIIENQVLKHTIHKCVINCCIKWKTKCSNCKKVFGPTGHLLDGKEEIYQEWDTHDRLIKRINSVYGINDTDHDK